MEAFLGTILPIGFNYAPRGWAFCNGQLLAISQNSALFSLLGTTYGGNGTSTFALPDLRGRVPVGSQGAGPGIANIEPGQSAGANNVTVIGNGVSSVTLSLANLPAHTHAVTIDAAAFATTMQASTGTSGTSTTPTAGAFLSASPGGPGSASIYSTSPSGQVNLGGVATNVGPSAVTLGNTGNGLPVAIPVSTTTAVSIMQPYLGVNFIIALQGIFPSRN